MRAITFYLAALVMAGCDPASSPPIPSPYTKDVGRYVIYHVQDPADPRRPLVMKLDTMLGDVYRLDVAPAFERGADGLVDRTKPILNKNGGLYGAIYWKYIPTTILAASAEVNAPQPADGAP
jgi:hypothetical protein